MGNSYELWLQKSEENLNWAEDNLKLSNFGLVCYLSQQAVELLLKGYIYSRDKIPPKTHQLVRLADIVKKLGLKEIDRLLPKLATLSEYYFESRYPDELREELGTEEVAGKALQAAREISDVVKRQLGGKGKGE